MADARILVVDDDEDTVAVIRTALKSEGYTVDTAKNGRLGVEAATENPPDLVILDIMMPEMNGAEAAAALKRNEKTSRIPIIMLTALKEKKYIKAAITKYGVDFYIVKPFDIGDFLMKVDQALSRAEEL